MSRIIKYCVTSFMDDPLYQSLQLFFFHPHQTFLSFSLSFYQKHKLIYTVLLPLTKCSRNCDFDNPFKQKSILDRSFGQVCNTHTHCLSRTKTYANTHLYTLSPSLSPHTYTHTYKHTHTLTQTHTYS